MSEYSEDFSAVEDSQSQGSQQREAAGPGPVAEREESTGVQSDDGSSLLASTSVLSDLPSKLTAPTKAPAKPTSVTSDMLSSAGSAKSEELAESISTVDTKAGNSNCTKPGSQAAAAPEEGETYSEEDDFVQEDTGDDDDDDDDGLKKKEAKASQEEEGEMASDKAKSSNDGEEGYSEAGDSYDDATTDITHAQEEPVVSATALSTATSLAAPAIQPPAPVKQTVPKASDPASSTVTDDTEALLRSSSSIKPPTGKAVTSRPTNKPTVSRQSSSAVSTSSTAAPTKGADSAKVVSRSNSISQAPPSKVSSKRLSSNYSRQQTFHEEEVEQMDDSQSHVGTIPASNQADEDDYESDYETEVQVGVNSLSGNRPGVSQTDLGTSTYTEDEPEVVIVQRGGNRSRPSDRPMSARPSHSSVGRSSIADGSAVCPASAHPTRTAPAPVAGSWLDDSWEGEVMPTIIPAQTAAVATVTFPARPSAPVPQSSAAPSRPGSSRGVHRPSTGGASTLNMSMTSGSVAGILAAPPPAYSPAPAWTRPVSAGPQLRGAGAGGALDFLRRNSRTWDTRDVANWVTYIGMEQYRKKFLHNCIDGRLLLGLSDAVLKQELGVGPLGHRAAILQAINALMEQADDMQPGGSTSASPTRARGARPASARPASAGPRAPEGPRRPASAIRPGLIPPDGYLGPALGKVTVYEQRSKLLFELDRAAARAAQHRVIAEQLNHTAALSADEVAHLRGLLMDLERKNKMIVGGAVGSVDSSGRVPWRPSSAHVLNPHPERMGKPGDDPSIDMTFQPRVSKKSKVLLNQAQTSTGHRSTFLDRLESDARKRERSRMESDRKFYSAEALFNDPLLAKRKARKDYAFLSAYLMEHNMISTDLSQKDSESDAVIDGLLQRCQDELGVPIAQLAGIHNARGTRKVSLLASALRTHQFMSRYDKEDAERRSGAKLRSLQEKHWESQMGKPKQRKLDEDKEQAIKYFEQLGWCGEDAITDGRLSALLKRVMEYKKAAEKARDQKAAGTGDGIPVIDWTAYPWAADGLAALQACAPRASPSAIEAAALQAAGGAGNIVKTSLAPAGTVTAGPAADVTADFVSYTVRLLAKCRWDDIERMDAWSDTAKQLGVYRHIRTQKFIEFTEGEIKAKERKLQETYYAMQRPTKVLSKGDADAFYERLLDDAAKRRITMEKAAADKAEKEARIKASSLLYGSGTRPRSAR